MDLIDGKQSKTIQDEQKRDVALYFVEDGEAGFNPTYNKMVIEKTIKKAEQLRKRKIKKYIENIQERADAVATYLKSRAAEGNTPIEKYFGKQWMSYLTGRRILNEAKHRMFLHKKVSKKGVLPVDRKVYLPTD